MNKQICCLHRAFYLTFGISKQFCKIICMISLSVLVQCSIIEPDHKFSIKKPHSYAPGSSRSDSLAVLAILKVNNISSDRFSSVVEIGSDWRVHSLDLSGMGIDTLPNEIGNLGALEHFNISNNHLKTLPDSITKVSIMYFEEHCQGPCGSSDCCWTESHNGLIIQKNHLCSIPSNISAWIDRHFGEMNYVNHDTTQQCQ